jgi:hypothetical protein
MDNMLDTGARTTVTVAATGADEAGCATALDGLTRNTTAAMTERAMIVIATTTTRKALLFFIFGQHSSQ